MEVLGRIGVLFLVVLYLTGGISYSQSTDEEIYNKGIEYAAEGKFKKAKEEFVKDAADRIYIRAECRFSEELFGRHIRWRAYPSGCIWNVVQPGRGSKIGDFKDIFFGDDDVAGSEVSVDDFVPMGMVHSTGNL